MASLSLRLRTAAVRSICRMLDHSGVLVLLTWTCYTIWLSSKCQSLRETRGKAGLEYLFLRSGNVVFQPAQFNRRLVHVIDDIRRFGVVVARLPNSTHIYEVLFARLDFEFGIRAST